MGLIFAISRLGASPSLKMQGCLNQATYVRQRKALILHTTPLSRITNVEEYAVLRREFTSGNIPPQNGGE